MSFCYPLTPVLAVGGPPSELDADAQRRRRWLLLNIAGNTEIWICSFLTATDYSLSLQ
jgi:hypothetical protein